jgi:alpha-tubulin suppressor-like RCC1 family protein
MKKLTKLSILTLASVLFAGTLLSASPLKVAAYEDFIVDLHRKRFLEVEVGENCAVLLSTDNKVYTMGRNDKGQLGSNQSGVALSNVPIDITSQFSLSTNEVIVDIDAGANHVVASTSSNRIFTWGENTFKQLGDGTSTNAFKPVDVTAGFNPNPTKTVEKIVASFFNTIVLFTDNTVRISGDNGNGNLLQGNFTQVSSVMTANTSAFVGVNNIIDIGMYHSHGYILLNTGKVGTWGNNAFGQLGNASTTISSSIITVSFSGLVGGETVTSVATGKNHSVALTSEGKIFFWGRNTNYAIGDALTLNDQKTSPFNVSAFFNVTLSGNSGPYLGLEYFDADYGYGYRALGVQAGEDSTFIRYARFEITDEDEFLSNNSYFYTMGLNKNGNIFSTIAWNDTDQYIRRPDDVSYNYWDYASILTIGYSATNIFVLNTEGDFTMFGSNVYGQMGLGKTSVETEYYNTNWSFNVRYFEEYVYDYLPSALNAPLDDYFTFDNDMPNERNDEYNAIFGYWYNDFYREYGIIDYYFGDIFTEKELSLITPAQWTKMRTIFAEIFEDEVLYGWIPNTNADFLTYLKANLEDRYWLRSDMEAMANYQSWELSWDDLVTLDADIIALLDPTVELRLNEFRTLLTNILNFEQNFLQPFINSVVTENNQDVTFTYLDEGKSWLDLGFDEIESLIELGYEDDILAIFTAYNNLTELEKLLLTEYYDYNYEELYLQYYYYFADAYSDQLWDFEYDIQDGDWDWYYPLFNNLTELQALLAGLDALNPISKEFFTYFEIYDEEKDYDYYSYEYWLHLKDLLPLLVEGKPVFDLFVAIEDGDIINYDDGYYYVDVKDAKQIIDMYNAFALLSEDAQDLLDIETISWYYELALEALAYEVEENLWNIEDIEYDEGYYGLFANYNDVLAALTSFEALPEDALEYLDDDSVEYYEYLLSIKLALAEGLTVYGLIVNIEDNIIKYDTQGNPYVDLKDVNTVLNMYTEYSKLSAEAKELLDPEYVAMIYTLALQAQANVVINQLNDLSVVEEDNGTYALFENYDDVAAALAAYNALATDAKNLLDEETQAYYAYLNGLRADLQAGLGVFNQIVTIEGLDLDNPSPATLTAISDMIDDFNSLTPAQQALLAPYVNDLKALALGRVSGLIDVLPADAETFEAAFNDPETKDATIANLLAAWEHYNALSDELKAELDEFEVARLQALHTRYLELIRPAMDLLMIGLIIVHLLSFTYFAFKKRDVLSPIVKD